MTTKCDRCAKPIPGGARICFECFCELCEEESMLLRKTGPRRTGAALRQGPTYVGQWYQKQCSHCWPFDCGCAL